MSELQNIVKDRANEIRMGFLRNTIALDQRQLLGQMEALGESFQEDESREGQASTQICIDLVKAVGRLKYPLTFDAAMRAHFVGEG